MAHLVQPSRAHLVQPFRAEMSRDVSNGYVMAMMTMIAIAKVLVAVDDDDGDDCSDDGNACHFSV